ncbi:MAG: hypothetical protein QG625_107 [Cyanobacteriota bacterium erpe_2018_sw_39hr_WHONDRS-SW48-000098_B_bin.30]|jgi:hypothetical protein|nr:hypothetical protein [Cyanobacteriota bacterium erpe_2018_sw_39hr_WHONDRS-SW48-000098_B_bin.30]
MLMIHALVQDDGQLVRKRAVGNKTGSWQELF